MVEPPNDGRYDAAIIERVARYTVGIVLDGNAIIGTGTLVINERNRYLLTARDVIQGVVLAQLGFWCPPLEPIAETTAKGTTTNEIGDTLDKSVFPVEGIIASSEAGVAFLKINAAFKLPDSSEFFDLSESRRFIEWPTRTLEALPLFQLGFPTDNFRKLYIVREGISHAPRSVWLATHYDSELNFADWSRISKLLSAEEDFLFAHFPLKAEPRPYDFSGCGVWIDNLSPENLESNSRPLLIGVTHTYFRRLSLLGATKLPKILEVLRRSTPL